MQEIEMFLPDMRYLKVAVTGCARNRYLVPHLLTVPVNQLDQCISSPPSQPSYPVFNFFTFKDNSTKTEITYYDFVEKPLHEEQQMWDTYRQFIDVVLCVIQTEDDIRKWISKIKEIDAKYEKSVAISSSKADPSSSNANPFEEVLYWVFLHTNQQTNKPQIVNQLSALFPSSQHITIDLTSRVQILNIRYRFQHDYLVNYGYTINYDDQSSMAASKANPNPDLRGSMVSMASSKIRINKKINKDYFEDTQISKLEKNKDKSKGSELYSSFKDKPEVFHSNSYEVSHSFVAQTKKQDENVHLNEEQIKLNLNDNKNSKNPDNTLKVVDENHQQNSSFSLEGSSKISQVSLLLNNSKNQSNVSAKQKQEMPAIKETVSNKQEILSNKQESPKKQEIHQEKPLPIKKDQINQKKQSKVLSQIQMSRPPRQQQKHVEKPLQQKREEKPCCTLI